MTVNGYRVSFWRNGNVLELDNGDSCSINILTTIELYIVKGKFNVCALYLNF